MELLSDQDAIHCLTASAEPSQCQICHDPAAPDLDLCLACQEREDQDRLNLYSHVKGLRFKVVHLEGRGFDNDG